MELMNPSHEEQLVASEPAQRLSSLEGTVIGVISNGNCLLYTSPSPRD